VSARTDQIALPVPRNCTILDLGGARGHGERLQADLTRRLETNQDFHFIFREEGIGLGEILSTGGAEFSMGVLAEDPYMAARAADQLMVELGKIDGPHDLNVDRVLGTTNVVALLDGEGILRKGLDPNSIAHELRSRIAGIESMLFNEIDQRIDIAVRLPLDQRMDLKTTLMASVRLAGGRTVPLCLS
jgi:multidrug efflux pump subunit AcrB